MTDDAVQGRAPGASTTPPPRPTRPPAPPIVDQCLRMPAHLETGEPRYTLAEARRILNDACAGRGHDLKQVQLATGPVDRVYCTRCPATFEPRVVLPPLPPDDELRKDMFSAGGHASFRLTHIPTGLVATAEGGRSKLEDLRRAEQLLRARLLVAQLEREATP